MECFLCEQDAVHECPRCGVVYCAAHGDEVCQRCADPALALPSYRVYRGSLLALLVGSVFAVWLLVRPPSGNEALSASSPPPPGLSATEVVVDGDNGSAEATSTAAGAEETATASTTATATASASATATSTATRTATPTPTETPTPTPTPEEQEYVVQPGDTMIIIAERFLPPGETVDDYVQRLAAYNGISDVAVVQLGQVLRIPPE